MQMYDLLLIIVFYEQKKLSLCYIK